MKDCIIAVDTGTTSMRAVLFSPEGHILQISQIQNPPSYLPGGLVEQATDSWKLALPAVLTETASAARVQGLRMAALSLSSNRSVVIPVDEAGQPLHPAIMWQDLRTEGLCKILADHAPEVYARSGLPITSVFSAVKMRWLRDHQPDIFARTAKFIGVQDYLMHLLTGDFVTDRSMASRTNLYNLENRDWDPVLLDIFGLPASKLCRLINPGETAGMLASGMAGATGLEPGIPVISAGGDQQCAALGMGLLSTRDVVANTGTGSYVISLADKPLHDDKMRLFCNVSAIPGKFVVEATIPASGVVYRWFLENFYDSASAGAGVFNKINAEADAAPPGADGAILLPHFTGAGAPRWNSKANGAFYGISLSTSRGHLARAVLEGIAAEMAENLSLMEELTGPKVRVFVSGGLTRFSGFNHILADMFGKPVSVAQDAEATATGAWINAAVHLGHFASHAQAHEAASRPTGNQGTSFEPDVTRHSIYQDLLARRSRLYDALAPMRN
ncbi:MAG: FGGY-family carbohydrate kinase [Spirochaetota bacterium]